MKTSDELLQEILDLASRKRAINSSLLNSGYIDREEYFKRAEEDTKILQTLFYLVQSRTEMEVLQK